MRDRNLQKVYAANTMEKDKKKQEFCHRIALKYIPFAVIIFIVTYWFIGLKNAQFI